MFVLIVICCFIAMNMEEKKIKLNTKDLDASNKGVLELVINEIKKCKYVINLCYRQSASKRGWHIKFYCSKDCDKCRKRFDDVLRYKADITNRKEIERNVLWDVKYYKDYETGKTIKRKAGKWVKVI